MYGSEASISSYVPSSEAPSRLQLSPNEQEIMDLKQRITANLEEIRHSVGCLFSSLMFFYIFFIYFLFHCIVLHLY